MAKKSHGVLYTDRYKRFIEDDDRQYFVDAVAREASGNVCYIEFQKNKSTDTVWDSDSLYMTREAMKDSCFEEFWFACVMKYDFFDMDTLYAPDWNIMAREAEVMGGSVWEVVKQLSPWLEKQYAAGAAYVGVEWDYTFW